MSFTVDILDHQYSPVSTQRLKLTPASYSSQAIGGPLEAIVDVAGDMLACWDVLNWLRYYVIIRNGNHTPVWWGVITRAEVQTAFSKVGVTIEDMRNRIIVDYTYDDAGGVPQSAETAWAEDAASIARYGRREERISLADTPVTMAEQKRDAWLAQVQGPVASIEMGEGEPSAVLTCAGLWSTLEWKFYANSYGREVYDESDDIEHLLGWGLTSTFIGFRNSAIHDLYARLGNLINGGKVAVTGSWSNNTTMTVAQPPGEGGQIVLGPSTTISFDPNDDIMDSIAWLGVFEAEEMILVTGSVDNDGYYWVKTTGHERIEVTGGLAIIDSEAAGAAVTIYQGHKATVDETVVDERPGNTTTLTALGTKLAQSFLMPSSWSVYEVMVRCKRIGTPSDNLKCGIYSGATPTTMLAEATVAGSSLVEDSAWVTWNFGTPPALTAGSTYWIVVERTGSNAHDACYVVGINSEKGYANGALKIWNGSSWVDRWEDADMPFQLWGQEQSSSQIDAILRDSGQFLAEVLVVDASGVWKRQYRDGTRRALAEVEELMETGTTSERRYVATVTPERLALVKAEPDATDSDPALSVVTGRLRQAAGGPWEPGVLPVGRWVQVVDAPPFVGLAMQSLSPIFVERADYDVAGDRMTLEPRGRTLPWDV